MTLYIIIKQKITQKNWNNFKSHLYSDDQTPNFNAVLAFLIRLWSFHSFLQHTC